PAAERHRLVRIVESCATREASRGVCDPRDNQPPRISLPPSAVEVVPNTIPGGGCLPPVSPPCTHERACRMAHTWPTGVVEGMTRRPLAHTGDTAMMETKRPKVGIAHGTGIAVRACPPRTRVALLLASLALPGAASAADDVHVEDRGGGQYTLTTTLDGTTDPSHGQLAIVPTAEALCGEL